MTHAHAENAYIVTPRDDMPTGPLIEFDKRAADYLAEAFHQLREQQQKGVEHPALPHRTVRAAGDLVIGHTIEPDNRDTLFYAAPDLAGFGLDWSNLDGGLTVLGTEVTTADGRQKDFDANPVAILWSVDLAGQQMPDGLRAGVEVEEAAIGGLVVYNRKLLPPRIAQFDPWKHLVLPPGMGFTPAPPKRRFGDRQEFEDTSLLPKIAHRQ